MHHGRSRHAAPSPDVTVVVVCRDGWSDLLHTLPRHPLPLVLVDNASRDGTARKVRALDPDVTVIELPENAGATARNVGVRAASTPYVAFADDDSWWEPGSLSRAVAALDDHPRLGLVAGRVLVGATERADPVCEQMAASPLPRDGLPGPRVLGFLACGAVVRRTAFLEAGGFDDVVFFMGEEERLALDLATTGWDLSYLEDVVAHHHPSPARDRRGRAVLAARNRLLTATMRLPPDLLLRTGAELLRTSAGRAAIRTALPRLPRALAARRPVPHRVAHWRRLLDRPSG